MRSLWLVSVVLLLASGCATTSVNLETTFYEGERYRLDMLFDVPQEALAWTPGGRAGLEQEIENLIAKGFQASWRAKEDAESRLLTCVVTMQGEGFDTLVEGGSWRVAPITYQGRQAIEVQILPQPLAAWGVGLGSLTLHGGDVVPRRHCLRPDCAVGYSRHGGATLRYRDHGVLQLGHLCFGPESTQMEE